MHNFDPLCNWEAVPLTIAAPELGDGSIRATGPCLPRLSMAAKKGWKYRSAGWCSWLWEESEMGLGGGSRLWFKLKVGHHQIWETMEDYAGRTVWHHVGRRGVKGLLLVCHEEVPCGFGLRTGDSGGDTADGAGDFGGPAQLSTDYWEESGV